MKINNFLMIILIKIFSKIKNYLVYYQSYLLNNY